MSDLFVTLHSLDTSSIIPVTSSYSKGVVLDDDQGVTGLFKNGQELKDCEGKAESPALVN